MPVEVLKSNDDEENKNDDQPIGVGAAPGAGGGGAGIGAPTSVGGAGAGASGTPVRGQKFQQVESFLKANQGAASTFAEGIGKSFEKDTDKISSAIEAGRSGFNQDTAAARTRTAGASDFIGNALQQAQQGKRLSAEDTDRFGQLRQGIKENVNATDFSGQAAGIEDLKRKQGLLKDEGGRAQLIRDQIGTPSYTQGQSRLDQLILQRSPEALGNLQNQVQAKIDPLTGMLETEQSRQNQSLNQINEATAAAQAQISGALPGMLQTDRSDIDKKFADFKAMQEAKIKDVKYGQFGEETRQWDDTYSINPDRYQGLMQDIYQDNNDNIVSKLAKLGLDFDPNEVNLTRKIQEDEQDMYQRGIRASGRSVSQTDGEYEAYNAAKFRAYVDQIKAAENNREQFVTPEQRSRLLALNALAGTQAGVAEEDTFGEARIATQEFDDDYRSRLNLLSQKRDKLRNDMIKAAEDDIARNKAEDKRIAEVNVLVSNRMVPSRTCCS